MTDEVKKPVTEEIQSKKHRRGITNETRSTSQLKFHDTDAASNGLFVGELCEVRVDWSVGSDNSSFAGIKTPRLTFHFRSKHKNANEQRHVYQTLFPVDSNVATIPDGADAWRVENTFGWIKHFLEVYYLKGRLLNDAEIDALMLPFEDFTEDENGNYEYVSVDPEEVAKGYGQVFDNVVSMFEGRFGLAEGETPKCCYKTADGNFISVWMKLLRHIRTKKGWTNVSNGDLAFPGFVGNGAIEIMRGNNPPAVLRLDISKESITPKEINKQPTIGGQGVPATMMGGAVIANIGGTAPVSNGAFAAAGDDMPF